MCHLKYSMQCRNNLINKKDSYLISCPPSWDDRNYSYGHQLYPSGKYNGQKEQDEMTNNDRQNTK
jgi:hypothetical protein